MLKCLLRLLIFMLPIVPSAAVTTLAQNNPYQLMEKVATKTFTRLKNESLKIKKNPDYMRDIMRQELLPYIQIKYASALVLGHYYHEATPEQRTNYTKAFTDYLVKVYSQILMLYHGQIYHIQPEQAIGTAKIITIRINIIDNDDSQLPIRLDFQWRKNSQTGNWQVYDMVAEGISMIITKQNEWNDLLRIKGISGLIKQLKNYANQPIISGDR
ncbi:phospholipid-binding protein MlaC [Pantoea sp. Aalb]|uniref:phospholipid-binding protein MlaC n=1 Tax=Pantoea sp. Aalb TaxID=2576762 RepID=UPI001322CAB7|nr:phospholipid-binding protein MlaC [Pantoea sp. Aalb]MXP67821.1 phospholipid-binding protein MlaC [Pantoea sp. Aalb]